MKAIIRILIGCLLVGQVRAQNATPAKPKAAEQRIKDEMAEASKAFLAGLTAEQRQQATFPFEDVERFNWYYVPRSRKGLPLKQMTADQKRAALVMLKTGLSDQGYEKAMSIMDMENVLRVIEKRSDTDTYRDPENYYFTIFGDPSTANPWSWRIDGHHLSLQFLSLTGRVLAQTPTFFGSNPGEVRIDVPQKGKQILRQETERAFALLKALTDTQRKQVVLDAVAYPDIVSTNRRNVAMERMDGLKFSEMNADQQKLFLELLQVYLSNYRITLAKQQLDKLEKVGLNNLRFGWAGDLTPQLGEGKGWYYRIHGPTILIEYDNTQNNANHIHTVVRDLTNDFGDDLLREHYQTSKHSRP
ncbi:DUF3500 domain-containing protein [Spirosoma soli]|uniref:DUF3500 domain-containing protein n=1 Tax=Spirosoma soli TaxID=1770529 RepID=A0ABW5M8W8_9BACT